MPQDPARWFSDSYAQATARFRTAADAAGVPLSVYRNPRLGPDGEALETLACGVGSDDADKVMVLMSGTHGTEALVGAGVQLSILAEPGRLLREGVRLVLIHVINPYGCAWGRYVNEDNVDLMKNLTYGDAITPTPQVFLEFDDALDLAHWGEPGRAERAALARREVVDRWGLESLMDALLRGQSDRPAGYCFNGRGATWSKRVLDTILAERLASAREVVFVDLHTGVGDWGEAYVMTSGDQVSRATGRAWLGETAHESMLPMDPPTHATLARFAPGARFVSFIIEAGTVTFGDDFREAMAWEMHHHLFGDPRSESARLNTAAFRRFYDPADDDWRRLFFANIQDVLGRIADHLRDWRPATSDASWERAHETVRLG